MMKLNRKVLFSATLATVVLAACGTTEAPATETTPTSTGTEQVVYPVDTVTSAVDWKGTMAGVKSHTGTLRFRSGEMTTTGGVLSGGSFTVDMQSYLMTDTNYAKDGSPQGTRADLTAHLMSADFFAADSFPTAHFVITKVDGNTATGNLTVRGHTNEEQVRNITLTTEGPSIHATGALTFNRQTYGVSWKSPMQDMVLSNDIVLTVDLKGTAN